MVLRGGGGRCLGEFLEVSRSWVTEPYKVVVVYYNVILSVSILTKWSYS